MHGVPPVCLPILAVKLPLFVYTKTPGACKGATCGTHGALLVHHGPFVVFLLLRVGYSTTCLARGALQDRVKEIMALEDLN